MQVNVMKAEVKMLVNAVEMLRDKHNILTDELTDAFTAIDVSFRREEGRWGLCETELQGIKGQLGRYGQSGWEQ